MDEKKLKSLIADNITYFRKRSGLTQGKLAELINYSDKSVSKWERGDGMPDVVVLVKLAEIFDVTVNDLVSEDKPEEKVLPARQRRHILIDIMSIILVWLVATVVFVGLRVFVPEFPTAWISYILAIPVSAIVHLVFACIWWNHTVQFFSISILVWTCALGIQMVFFQFVTAFDNISLIYICAAVLQVLALAWTLYRNFKKKK